jgi:hypothetical protein
MNSFVRKSIAILIVCLTTIGIVNGQDKKVTVLGLYVGNKPVKSTFSVELTSSGKHYDLRTETGAFFIPAGLELDKSVNIVIRFKKYVLEFSDVHYSNFDTDWLIGVVRSPYRDVDLNGANPKDVLSCYYVEFPSEEPGRKWTVVVTKNK